MKSFYTCIAVSGVDLFTYKIVVKGYKVYTSCYYKWNVLLNCLPALPPSKENRPELDKL